MGQSTILAKLTFVLGASLEPGQLGHAYPITRFGHLNNWPICPQRVKCASAESRLPPLNHQGSRARRGGRSEEVLDLWW